jgi:hypothetical protein
LDWFEAIKTIVQLLLSISSLTLSVAIYRRTKQIRALDSSNVVDLVRTEIRRTSEEHEILMKTIKDLSASIEKIERKME